MTVVTRFAPSPTGYLHIGGARTALFNLLFARHHGGRFLLRIEDTDRARSTPEAVAAIDRGLEWLDIRWDGEPISQFSRADRHAAAARMLLDRGHAYLCYATPEELTEMREQARAEGRSVRYDGRWRDRDPREAPAGVPPVVRFKAPREGETRIRDLVQGEVTVANAELDDMVLLRADGTPTYMLAVVVDDHDMGITHVIRGDDHFTNTFRQYQLFTAFDWAVPAYAHIPLIHGSDGAKLSKRHGALAVEAYRDQGFLPEAVGNYLLRLGWSHGDDEIISRDQAIEWFDLANVGRSPSRFDLSRLLSLNAHYLRRADDRRLAGLVVDRLAKRCDGRLAANAASRIIKGMPSLKERAKTIEELAEKAMFYALDGAVPIDPRAAALLTAAAKEHLARVSGVLGRCGDWRAETLERAVRDYVETGAGQGLKLATVAQPLRAALTGSSASPPVFEVMEVLGKRESLARLSRVLDAEHPP
ncbi:MAG: glutamate--tRNA ligase [Rhodospirillales bacterium]